MLGDFFYHVPVRKGEVPRYILAPGAPERVDLIAKFMDRVHVVRQHREFRIAIGVYNGVKVAAASTGIGGPSTSIALEELARAGADTFIRVGTCGAIQDYVDVGDVVVASAAVRLDGSSLDYAPPEYPAVATPHLVALAVEVLEKMGVKHHVGIVASTSTFYTGQGRPGYGKTVNPLVANRLELLRSLKVLCFEMETATIYTIANVYGLRALSLCSVIANRVTGTFKPEAGVEKAIKAALNIVKALSMIDDRKLKPTPSTIHSVVKHVVQGGE